MNTRLKAFCYYLYLPFFPLCNLIEFTISNMLCESLSVAVETLWIIILRRMQNCGEKKVLMKILR